VLPSLRSSKTEGQANFVNPGVLMFNAGWDAELTPNLRTTVNVNTVSLDKVETLQRLLFQGAIDRFLGVDVGVGFQWRPWLTDNVVITAGASVFQPSKGFEQILRNGVLYTPFIVATFTY